MARRIPIAAAKRIAEDYDMDQVVLVTFSKSTGRTHVVTYGKTVEECRQAAQGGNLVKKALGWPDELCHEKEVLVSCDICEGTGICGVGDQDCRNCGGNGKLLKKPLSR